MSPALLAAGRRRYVALTTYRRSGVAVTTPVWVAASSEGLVVTTGARTGKAKRLRNDPRVELQECSARGRVRPGAPRVAGRAEVVSDPAEQARLGVPLARKYGLQLRLVRAVETLAERRGHAGNVILRITDA